MSTKTKTIITLIGLGITLIGLILIYRDFENGKVSLLPVSLFILGVFTSFKILVKTKHKSKKFKITKD